MLGRLAAAEATPCQSRNKHAKAAEATVDETIRPKDAGSKSADARPCGNSGDHSQASGGRKQGSKRKAAASEHSLEGSGVKLPRKHLRSDKSRVNRQGLYEMQGATELVAPEAADQHKSGSFGQQKGTGGGPCTSSEQAQEEWTHVQQSQAVAGQSFDMPAEIMGNEANAAGDDANGLAASLPCGKSGIHQLNKDRKRVASERRMGRRKGRGERPAVSAESRPQRLLRNKGKWRGVERSSRSRKWTSKLHLGGHKYHHISTMHETEESAACVHDRAAIAVFGRERAITNFPLSEYDLQGNRMRTGSELDEFLDQLRQAPKLQKKAGQKKRRNVLFPGGFGHPVAGIASHRRCGVCAACRNVTYQACIQRQAVVPSRAKSKQIVGPRQRPLEAAQKQELALYAQQEHARAVAAVAQRAGLKQGSSDAHRDADGGSQRPNDGQAADAAAARIIGESRRESLEAEAGAIAARHIAGDPDFQAVGPDEFAGKAKLEYDFLGDVVRLHRCEQHGRPFDIDPSRRKARGDPQCSKCHSAHHSYQDCPLHLYAKETWSQDKGPPPQTGLGLPKWLPQVSEPLREVMHGLQQYAAGLRQSKEVENIQTPEALLACAVVLDEVMRQMPTEQ